MFRLALASLASSVLFGLAWPPFGLWWLVFVAAVPVLAVLTDRSGVARRWWTTWLVLVLTQWPAWLFFQWWMIQLTPPGMVGLVLYCTVWTSAAFLVVGILARNASATGRLPLAILAPVAWTAVEFLRSTLVLGGYPWYQFGTPLVAGFDEAGVFAQSAALFGEPFLASVAMAANGALVDVWHRRRGHAGVATGRALGGGVAAALLVGAVAVYGLVRDRGTLRPGPATLLVQTNVSTSNKIAWSPEDQRRDVASFLRQSIDGFDRAAALGRAPALVVWPETMVPGFGLEPETIATLLEGPYFPGNLFSDALDRLHRRLGVPLLVGAPVYLGLRVESSGGPGGDPTDGRWVWDRHFNSAYLIQAAPPYQRYDKLVLTPFGEEMPLISRSDWLEERLLAFGAPGMSFDLEAGDGIVRFTVDGTVLATPICFEDTVGWLCRDLVYERGAKATHLLVNLSNDGWFGWSDIGRAHHLTHARVRSIELAVPMLRAANTGYSVLIDDEGRVTAWVDPPDAEAAGRPPGAARIPAELLAEPILTDRVTLYGRIGDVWAWTMLGSLALLLIAAFVGRSRGSVQPSRSA